MTTAFYDSAKSVPSQDASKIARVHNPSVQDFGKSVAFFVIVAAKKKRDSAQASSQNLLFFFFFFLVAEIDSICAKVFRIDAGERDLLALLVFEEGSG